MGMTDGHLPDGAMMTSIFFGITEVKFFSKSSCVSQKQVTFDSLVSYNKCNGYP